MEQRANNFSRRAWSGEQKGQERWMCRVVDPGWEGWVVIGNEDNPKQIVDTWKGRGHVESKN